MAFVHDTEHVVENADYGCLRRVIRAVGRSERRQHTIAVYMGGESRVDGFLNNLRQKAKIGNRPIRGRDSSLHKL